MWTPFMVADLIKCESVSVQFESAKIDLILDLEENDGSDICSNS